MEKRLKRRNPIRLRRAAAGLLACLFCTACAAPTEEAVPAEPVLVFDEREVVLELEAGAFRGTLRRDLQQRAVLTFTAPERVEGLTFVSSQTGIKLQCEGLSTEPAVLPGPAGAVLEALYAASLPESLLRTETGLMGELPDGTAFSLETDAAGTLLSVTVPGGRMVFPQPVVEEEN